MFVGHFNEPYNRHSTNTIEYSYVCIVNSNIITYDGRVAQLEERGVCNAEAWGSNPHASTPPPDLFRYGGQCTRKRELPGKGRESLTLRDRVQVIAFGR